MKTIYAKKNFSIILISSLLVIFCLFLIDYHYFVKYKNINVSDKSGKITKLFLVEIWNKSGNNFFGNKRQYQDKTCSVTVAVILCQAEEYLSITNILETNKTREPHVAKDFSRQINQTLVMLKSIALQTVYRNRHHKIYQDCITVIILTEKKKHFETIENAVESEWGDQFKSTLNLKFVPVAYPKGAEWMKKMFRPCATLRLFIPELIPLEINTLIYLDTDLIFLNSLQKLMDNYVNNGGFDGKLAAMAPCLFHYGSKTNTIPYYGSSGLNAGLMIMNLKRMRETMWTNRIRMITAMFQKQIKLADQDILNIYFHFFPEELSLISCDWNFRPFQCRKGSYCKDPELAYGISALHGNALSFTPTGPESIFYTVYSAFHSIKLKNNFNLHNFLQDLETKLSRSALHSNCVRYKGFATLILNRFDKLLEFV